MTKAVVASTVHMMKLRLRGQTEVFQLTQQRQGSHPSLGNAQVYFPTWTQVMATDELTRATGCFNTLDMKTVSVFCCIEETHLSLKDRHHLRVKGWKKFF